MPYDEHPAFTAPDSNASLWRYMDLAKLISLIHQAALHFTRCDRLGDRFEGSTTAVTKGALRDALIQGGLSADAAETQVAHHSAADQLIRRVIYANCWHRNEHESAAMWQLYVKSGLGIAIRTTYDRLRACVTDSRQVFIGEVCYIDYNAGSIPFGNVFSPLLHKRISFSHENEVRALVMGDLSQVFPISAESYVGTVASDRVQPPLGLPIEVDLPRLIEAIYVSPQAESWFTDVVSDILAKYAIAVPVRQSDLDRDPLW